MVFMRTGLVLTSFAMFAVAGCELGLGWVAETQHRLLEAEHPAVARVYYQSDWLDGTTLFVELTTDATDIDAREVWCDLINPTTIPDDIGVVVGPTDAMTEWDAPDDCADLHDVPALRSGT